MSKGVKCKSGGLWKSHREGMWTTCAIIELHSVAFFCLMDEIFNSKETGTSHIHCLLDSELHF